ncbi:autophagy protein atg9 [Dinochytrium kinnereticum]|nr:autophagy protein atg9 [Dinochytrium kinnereticum]
MSGGGFDEVPLPFAFTSPPHLGVGPPSSVYQGNSFLAHHVNDEIPPDDSQLESQRLDVNEDYEDSDDEEAPNDLMIEMNPLLPEERTTISPPRYQQPPRPPPTQRNLLFPKFQMDMGRRTEDVGGRPLMNFSGRSRRMNVSNENQEPIVDAKERIKQEVLKMWSDADNLDEFLRTIYEYFCMKGFTAMLLSRTTNLLVHGLPASFLLLFSIWWLWQITRLIIDTPKLFKLKLFYELILEIPEAEMDTLTWREVVLKVAKIKDIPNSNSHGQAGLEKLDAHNIANRIMRRENYMIAIFNKDILDLSLPYLGKRQILTKIMEWNLSFCILSYVFDEKGEEYTKNPSQIGARQYSPFAWWKFREFNELPHLYQERLNKSYGKATKYMEQFPKEKNVIIARFVSFVAGSFAAALAVLTLADKQFLEFVITPQRSVFFYIGVFGGLATAARAMIPEENQVFEPERALREVAEDTHYLPDSWRGSYIVKSGDIIDFFREFTVYVDSLGYVCSFAVFNFRAHGNPRYGAPIEGSSPRHLSKEGKMEQSFLFFKANNPDWEPDNEGSLYVQNLSRAQRNFMSRGEASTADYMTSTLLRPQRRTVKSGQQSENVLRPLSESMMIGSDMEAEDRPLGLFGLLDAIYETNSRGFSRVT